MMDFRTKTLGRSLGVALLGASFLFMGASDGHAVAFSTDLTVTGSADFDAGTAFFDGASSGSGDFGVTGSSATPFSTYSGLTVTGSDPVSDALTDIGHGVGASATTTSTGTSGDIDDDYFMAIDLAISLTNTSATDTYTVTFKVDFSNAANADGADAAADSEFTILDTSLVELFFTDLLSDTLNGDAKNGDDPLTFGDALTDSGTPTFDITFAPGATETLDGTLVIEAFVPDGTAAVDFSAFLSIEAVVNDTTPEPEPQVPEPATMLLFGTGLLGLGAIRRRRAKRGW